MKVKNSSARIENERLPAQVALFTNAVPGAWCELGGIDNRAWNGILQVSFGRPVTAFAGDSRSQNRRIVVAVNRSRLGVRKAGMAEQALG